jgi:hypothetical protein
MRSLFQDARTVHVLTIGSGTSPSGGSMRMMAVGPTSSAWKGIGFWRKSADMMSVCYKFNVEQDQDACMVEREQGVNQEKVVDKKM